MKLTCGRCGISDLSCNGKIYCPILADGQSMEPDNVCDVWAIIHAVMQEAKDQEEHSCNTACNQGTCRLTYLSLFIPKTEE